MAGISFDDLVPSVKKSGAVTFDDLQQYGLASDLSPEQKSNMNPADVIVPSTGSAAKAYGIAISGGQIPFANRITSAMAAGAIAPFVDETYSQLYRQSMADTRAIQEAHPTATMLGNITGAVSTLPTVLSTMPGKAGATGVMGVLNPVRNATTIPAARGLKYVTDATGKLVSASPFKGSGVAAGAGNLAAKMVGGAAVAAPVTGAYFAGEAQPGEMGEQFVEGAKLGGALGVALPVAGLALSKTVDMFQKKPQSLTSEQIREIGSYLYKQAAQKGGVLKPNVFDSFVDEIGRMSPQTTIGKALEGESPVVKAISSLQSLKGSPLTLDAAMEADQILGDLAYKNVDTFGKIDSNGQKFLDMQSKLRKTIETAPESSFVGGKQGFESVKDARRFWATQLRLRDIERVINNAEFYEQPSTAIKNGFRSIMKSSKFSQYSAEEQKMIKRAATTGFVEGGLRLAGSGLVPIVSGTTGAVAGGPMGAALSAGGGYAVQQGAKKAAEAMRYSRANDVTKQILNRVPDARGLLQLIEQGGQVTGKMVSDLPQAEKNKFLKYVAGLPAAQATAIMNGTKDKVQ